MSAFHLDTTLYTGRPSDAACRGLKELRCYDLLDKLDIAYLRADHDPADTVADCQAVEAVIGVGICKNLFLCNRGQTRFYLLMMPALKPFKTRIFSKLIGSSRLSFGDEAHMAQFLGCTPGSVSILGLMNDKEGQVQLAIDADVLRGEHIRCHPCQNTSTLRLSTDDVLNKLLPAIGHTPIIVEQPWEIDEETD